MSLKFQSQILTLHICGPLRISINSRFMIFIRYP